LSAATQIVERLRDGDVRALARAISIVEEGTPSAAGLLRSIFPHTGRARVLGLTGAPGSGKSTLVDRLVAAYRGDGCRVGVVAVDPSSTFSGGAILGDRVRMQDHAGDPGVFIRSMATRGHLGGLARATNDAIDVLDAAGFDPILVETVGVGQDEVEVVKTAGLVAVVLVPGMGDDIQAIKAGILEIADAFVINKADRPGVDRLQADLDYMLSLVSHEDRDRPQIFRTTAVRGEGVAELKDELLSHDKFRDGTSRLDWRRERAQARFLTLLGEKLLRGVLQQALPAEALGAIVDDIAERRTDPYSAVDEILRRLEVR